MNVVVPANVIREVAVLMELVLHVLLVILVRTVWKNAHRIAGKAFA